MEDHYQRNYHGPPSQDFASRPLASITESTGQRSHNATHSIHYQTSMSTPDSLAMWQHMPPRPSNAAISMMGPNQQNHDHALMMLQAQGLYYSPPVKMFSPQQQPQNASFYHASLASSKRFSEEEKQKLEKVFKEETQKPSTSRKRQLAEELRCPVPKVNNWFQNRRAREKQMHRVQAYEASQAAGRIASGQDRPDAPEDDVELVEDTIDSDSESMGSQQQIKTASEADDSSSGQERPTPDSSDGRGSDSVVDSPACPPEEAKTALHFQDAPREVEIMHRPASQPQLDVALNNAQFNNPQQILSSSPEAFEPSQDESSFQMLQNQFGPRFTSPADMSGLGVFNGDGTQTDYFPTSTSFMTQRTPTITTSIAEHDDMTGHQSGEHDSVIGFSGYHSLSPDMDMVPQLSPNGGQADSSGTQESQPISIASRRKIRPPQRLDSTALRDFQNGPKTGIEDPKRTDLYKSMRRTASATGPLSGKITKSAPPVSPRSPRNFGVNLLEQLARQSSLSAAASQFNGASSASPIGSTLERGYLSAGNPGPGLQHRSSSLSLKSHAERMSLSPGTSEYKQDGCRNRGYNPGLLHFQGSKFAQDSGCGNISPDEPLATPGLSHFGDEFDFASSLSAPRYVESEPTTPSYVPVTMAASSTAQSNGYPTLKIETPAQANTFPWSRSPDHFALWNGAPLGQFGETQSQTFQFQPNITPSNFQPPAGSQA